MRDAKIADVESYIKISKNHVEKLNKNLNDLLQQAAAMEQRGEPPGENTARDIESVRKQIREQEALITSKRADQEAIRKKYDADLARYRDIKSKAAAAASGEPDDTATAEAKSP